MTPKIEGRGEDGEHNSELQQIGHKHDYSQYHNFVNAAVSWSSMSAPDKAYDDAEKAMKRMFSLVLNEVLIAIHDYIFALQLVTTSFGNVHFLMQDAHTTSVLTKESPLLTSRCR